LIISGEAGIRDKGLEQGVRERKRNSVDVVLDARDTESPYSKAGRSMGQQRGAGFALKSEMPQGCNPEANL
jgi:hypothetical protein